MFRNQDGISLIVNLSGQYPLIYEFTILLSAFLGFAMSGTVLYYLAKLHVTQTISPERFNWALAIPALLIAGLLGALATTMGLASGSLLDVGGGSLLPPSEVNGTLEAKELLSVFAEQTARLIGWFFGLWGLIEMYVSRMPDRDRTLIWSGLIRFAVGSILINLKAALNLLGGLGELFF